MDKILMANRRVRPIAFIALAIAIVMAMAACSDSGNADAISGIEASVSAQSAEIEALSAQIGDLQAELADSQKMETDEVAQLRAGIEELRGQEMMTAEFDDSALKSDIGDIRSMVAELQSRMDEDDDDDERIDSSHLDSLDAQLMGLGDTLAELKASMSGDEGSMDELAMEIGALRTDVMVLRDESASMEIADLLARLDWLEGALGPSYTQAYVEQAIRRYNADGRQATLDYYNTLESVSGDLYLFVLDENYRLIVHPTVPTTIGMDIRGPLGTDITGKNYGAESVTVDEQGKWVDYVYLNPANDFDYERKHSWVVRHDNLLFGSGWYERDVSLESTPPAYARALVEQAVARYDADGRESTLARYNDPASVDGQYYVFVVDTADLRSIANGARPDFVGTIPDRIDSTGYDYGKDIAAATEEGGWISYVILNLDTGEQQRKHSWITLHDGLVFGSGWYEPVIAARDDPPAYTQAFVEQAIARYESDGHDATIEYYNSPESIDGQWYVFIGDENDVMLAHAAVPANVGLHFDEVISPDGYPAGAQAAAAAVDGGAWTTYTYLNAATGNVEMKHSWATRHNGMIFGSGWYEEGPPKSDPAAYTQAFVQRAINLYDDLGHDGTVAYYNSPESIDGQWYVFIGDEDDVMIAHATVPANVGLQYNEVISPTDGYPAGAQVAAAAVEGGAWTTYTYLNAATGNVETKHSWVTRHNGMIFGSGWYEEGAPKSDAAAYTRAFVQRAINLYNDLGHEGAIAYYNSPESVDGQWYIFIGDEDDVMIAHAAVPANVGLHFDEVISPTDSYPAGAQVAAAAIDGGAWTTYTYLNAATGNVETKHSWVTRHNGMIFGSGWYAEGAPKSDEPAYAQSLVSRAMNLYDDLGREATIDYYNTPESVDGPWYVFILRAEDLRTFANGARPELVDIDPPERIDANGYAYGEAFATATDVGKWVSYVFLNPATNELESKHSWVMEHDGFLFGSGWYTEPAEYTQYLVEDAISLYESEGRDAAIAHYNMLESVDGQWYVFIVDSDDLFLSHAPSPSLLGTDLKAVVGSDGYELGKEIAKATEDGHWVEYLWPNPATDTEETKRSWVIRHDGLVFGSGYYGEPDN